VIVSSDKETFVIDADGSSSNTISSGQYRKLNDTHAYAYIDSKMILAIIDDDTNEF